MPDLYPPTERINSEPELEFELGGPAYRLMQRVGIIKGTGPSVGRRSIAFLIITWLPLLLFTTFEGHAFGPTPRSAFLLDFASYARFFLAVPLIFVADMMVGPQMHNAGLRFLRSGLVGPESSAGFDAAVARVRRRRDAYLPEILFLVVGLLAAWFVSVERMTGLESTSWHTTWVKGEFQLSLAALWYNFVATPLLQFFVLRWLWRLVIWTLFLWDVSRLRLNLVTTHTDMAGGIGFLGIAHVSLAIFPFAVGCVLCAELAFRICFEGLSPPALQSMMPLLIAYVVFVEFATFGPLLIFVPVLMRARRAGLRTYGLLVQQHNQLFQNKWIDGDRPVDESPLGNPDMSSLVDLGSSYTVIRQMNIIPVGRTQLVQVAVIACLPGLPLIFFVLPFVEVLRLLLGTVT
jgi:hypothetical protein